MTDSTLIHATEQISRAQQQLPVIKAFFDQPTYTVTYVVHDKKTKCAAIIDSVFDFDPASGRTSFDSADEVIAYVKEQDLTVQWLLETHAHADHLSAAPYLQEKLGGKIAIGEHIVTVQDVFGKLFNAGTDFQRDGSDFDRLFADGDTFKIGDLDVTVMHVPGHTPADIAYVIGDAVFVGDTMFMPDYGTARADFPGGDDYLPAGRTEYVWETTVAEQRKNNIHAHDGVTEDEFVKMRTERDKTLDMPRLILPSVQVNMRAGHLPPEEDNGVRYLKVPLNGV